MRLQQPKISFIAPLYSVEPFVRRFMHSYFSQTIIEQTELIIVDDASPDNSLALVQQCIADVPQHRERVTVLRHEQNRGLAAARQTGLDAARGDYVFFADSDDFFDETLAEDFLAKAEDTHADIICADWYYDYQAKSKYVPCTYNQPKEKIIQCILNNTIGGAGQPTRLVKRSLFYDNDIRFVEGINMFEDRVLAVKLFFYARTIAYMPKAYYHYVQYNTGSITKKYTEKTISEMQRAEQEIETFLTTHAGDRFAKSILDFKCYIKFLVWLKAPADQTDAQDLYPEATRHILCSKSIPKRHTRWILYLYCTKHLRAARFFSGIVRTIKKPPEELPYPLHTSPAHLTCDVSVIIVNYNTRDLLRDCLRSLYAHTKDIAMEVFVSDNGSKDGSLDMVRTEFPQVRILDNNANLGFGAANNRALAHAQGKYVFYLNSDTVLLNNAVKLFFDYWEQHDSAGTLGAIGANLLSETDQIIHSAGHFKSINTEIKDALHDLLRSYKLILPVLKNKKLGKEPPAPSEIIGPVDYVTGADLFVKNTASAYFDERYFLYYEETDLQKMLALAGKERRLIPGPRIRHLKGQSNAATAPIQFYASVSKIHTFLSCCKFQHKFYRNPVRLCLLKCIITLHWLNPQLVKKTGAYIATLWRT